MEITLIETSSKEVKKLESEVNGYKVVANVTVNNGKIEILNGDVRPSAANEGEYVEGYSFYANKSNGAWNTDVSRVPNEYHAAVSEIAVAAVEYVVNNYERAE